MSKTYTVLGDSDTPKEERPVKPTETKVVEYDTKTLNDYDSEIDAVQTQIAALQSRLSDLQAERAEADSALDTKIASEK